MGLFNFTSKEEKERLSHIRNLLTVAVADGKLHPNELAQIAAIAHREGITDEEFKKNVEKCIKKPDSIKFIAPTDAEKRSQYLADLVGLMMIDGDIHPKEMLVCKGAAIGLGFPPEIVEASIAYAIEQVRNNLS